MKLRGLFFVLMIFSIFLANCNPAAPAVPGASSGGGEIKVALLAPISGPVPAVGAAAKEGFMAAVDEWNAKGGLLGKKIVPLIEDSQCTPDPAVNAANKVINQDGVHYIVGESCSKATIPVSELANSKNVVLISAISTNVSVTLDNKGKVKPYVFRACFIDAFQGKISAEFAYNNLKAKTAFMLVDQSNDFVTGLTEVFEKTFKGLGGQIVGKENYTSKDTDFSTILSKVADAKPEILYVPDYYNIANLVGKQAKEKGITSIFIGSEGWDNPDLDLKAVDGGYYISHYNSSDPRPEVQAWVKMYGEKYKDDKGQPKVPDSLSTLHYDATSLLFTAIQKSGADDPVKVKDTMAGLKYGGVSGQISFDQNHDPIKSATIMKVADGKKVFETVVNP